MKRLNLDSIFQFALLGLLLLLIWESRRYPLESRLYPQIIGGATIVLLLVSLIRHFREGISKKESTAEAAKRQRRFFRISLVVVLATVVGFLGGFILSVLCYYVAYVLFHEDRSRLPRNLTVGVLLTVLFYISFNWFMKVPLLRGWFWDF